MARSRGSIFLLTQPGIGQGGNIPAQIRREGVELPQRKPVLAPSLSDNAVSAVDHITAGVALPTDGPELKREEAPEPRLLLVGEAVFAITHIPPGNSIDDGPGFLISRLRVFH